MQEEGKIQLFISLSQVLTGQKDLSETVGREYLSRISTQFDEQLVNKVLSNFQSIIESGEDIVTLVKAEIIGNQEQGKLSREIIMLWYTGQFVGDNGNTDSGTASHYFEALMWKIIQAHPPGRAGGVYGYWAVAPEDQS